MYNQNDYAERERFAFTEAMRLASAGEEFSHLISLMGPDYAMRLRIAVQQMPDEIRAKTCYGRSVGPLSAPTKRKRSY